MNENSRSFSVLFGDSLNKKSAGYSACRFNENAGCYFERNGWLRQFRPLPD